MDIQINQQLLAEVLQIGGQYIIPIASLLRALYSGARGRLPEGIGQIITAATVAGVSAGVSGTQPDFGEIIRDVFSNTVFTAGLLTFIVLYLLRVTNMGRILDIVIGGLIGAAIWVFTVYVLQQPWPIWFLLLIIPACAVGMLLLRFALRQIKRVVRVATFLLVVGLGLAIGAGGFMLFQTITQRLAL